MAIKTSTNATQNDLGQLGQWQEIYNLFKGSKPTTATRTTQTQLSPDATQAMLQQILESQQGLANVAAGQKGRGLYNSSTNQMLTNKLLSDTAAKVSLAGAPTVVTDVQSGGGGGIDKGMLAGYAGLKLLTSDTGKKATKSVVDYLFGDSGAGQAAAPVATSVGSMLGTISGGGLTGGAADSTSGAVGSAIGSVIDWIGGATGWWADGGRVPVKRAWANGGRVAGLHNANTGKLPTITSLGRYSSSVLDDIPSAAELLSGTMESESVQAAAGTPRGAWDTPGAWATNVVQDITGLTSNQAASLVSGAGKAGAGMLGTALAGALAGPAIAANIANPNLAQAVMGTVSNQAKSAMQGLVDSPEMMSMKSNEAKRSDLGLDVLGSWWSVTDPDQVVMSQARAMEVDPQVMAEERSREEALAALAALQRGEDPSSTDDTNIGSGAGYGEDTRAGGVGLDESGDTPSDLGDLSSGDSYGPEGGGNFGSSDPDGSWAKGGRVKGDKNYGHDDVPIRMSAKAGGGIGFLDGGEHVLKATTVKKLDGALGRKFLDELNENPDKLIQFIMNGKE